MTIGQKVKELRLAKNYSLRKLGFLAGFDFAQISKIENEYDSHTKKAPNVSLDAISRICYALEYDFALFLEETQFIPPRPADEVELIEAYRSLTEENKKVALNQVKSLVTR